MIQTYKTDKQNVLHSFKLMALWIYRVI